MIQLDELKSLLWGAAVLLRGKINATGYKEYIFPLVFFKRISDVHLEEYRKALTICGRTSGRDGDKWANAGLTPYPVDGTTGVAEAEMILVCKKLYAQEMKPECFMYAETDEKNYPQKDYHTMYIAEIEKVLVRE